MTKTNLTSRIRRRPVNRSATSTLLIRQWQLLEWLSACFGRWSEDKTL